MGTELITFSTGTRNPDYMWGRPSRQQHAAAWADMVAAMEEAVALAEAQGATLVFEPEVNNVVDSAQKARRLLDEGRSKHLQVVIDGSQPVPRWPATEDARDLRRGV